MFHNFSSDAWDFHAWWRKFCVCTIHAWRSYVATNFNFLWGSRYAKTWESQIFEWREFNGPVAFIGKFCTLQNGILWWINSSWKFSHISEKSSQVWIRTENIQFSLFIEAWSLRYWNTKVSSVKGCNKVRKYQKIHLIFTLKKEICLLAITEWSNDFNFPIFLHFLLFSLVIRIDQNAKLALRQP